MNQNETHPKFGLIMMTFFTVYTLVALLTVLSAIPAKAVEYLDAFPEEPESLQFIKSEVIDTCKDGSTIVVFAYRIIREPGSTYIEAYLSSDKEEPISVMFAEYDDDGPIIDIYIRELNKIAWYKSMFEFKEAYPEGVCPKGIEL